VSTTLVGPLVQTGSTSGTLTHQVPATVTSYSLTWPAAVAATTGYVLSSTDAGVLSWVAQTGGGLTIGDSITSGTANRVLYENSSNLIAESANFTYDASTLTIVAPSTATPLEIRRADIRTNTGADYHGLVLKNPTASDVTYTVQRSPQLALVGHAYEDGGPDYEVGYMMQAVPSAGEGTACSLVWYSNSGGGWSATEQMRLSTQGTLTLNGPIIADAIYMPSTGISQYTTGWLQFNADARTTGNLSTSFEFVTPAHTGMGTSAFGPMIHLNMGNTVTFADNTTVTEHHGVMITETTLASTVATKEITSASTLTILDDPNAGSNVSIPNAYAVWVKAGAVRLDGSAFGAFGVAPVTQPTSGADLVNNVTSGGTSDQIDDFTDLSTYATDAAAIRNAIYQLARKLKQVNDGLRDLGLLS